MYRLALAVPEVLLVHPGGPFWARKDIGAWSIPKGEFEFGREDPLAAARREFREETGFDPSAREFFALDPVQQRSGKTVHAWAAEFDCDPEHIVSNTITIEWPPHSGRRLTIPEVDRAAWFSIDAGRHRIVPAQAALIDQLQRLLNERSRSRPDDS
jgi:predicted NUDIX family NTP pyrophosphohydrolase